MCYNYRRQKIRPAFLKINIIFFGGVYRRVQVSLSVFLPLHFGDLADASATCHQWLFPNQFLFRNAYTYQDPQVRCSTTVNGYVDLHTHPGSNANGGPNRRDFAHATF
jgi:hypothetical protein